MVRNLMVAVCALALTLTSCGRQVTPNRTNNPNGLQSGQMEIKFTMANPVNFVNDWYVLAFNVSCTDTTGQTCEPYAQYGNQVRNWLNWDYEIIVFQPNTSSSVQVQMWEFLRQQSVNGPTKQPIQLSFTPRVDINLLTNCNGTANQFCVIVNRRLFNGIVQGGATPPPPSNVWYVNWIVASPNAPAGQPQGQAINAPGIQGINDTTFQFPAGAPGINVTTTFDQQWFADTSWPQPSDPGAAYAGGEVINAP